MTNCEWLAFDAIWIGIALLAIVSIWKQRRDHDRRLREERERFYRGSLQ